jgi:Spy/CpxP family protein refolding chaperone
MRKTYFRAAVAAAILLAFLGFGTYAFAEWGRGYGRQFMGDGQGWQHGGCPRGENGPGWHHRGPGFGGQGNLSAEEAKKLDQEREAFFESTKNIRQGIYQKHLELQAEFAKKDPDVSKAQALYKEISDYRVQMGQKHFEHQLKMKKLFPDLTGPGAGFGGKYWGKGFGGGPGCRN